MRVLDVGCGTGTLAVLLKRTHPLADVTALDGSEDILALARSKADSAGVNISFVHGLSYEMPFEAGEFDMVFTSFFFHHLIREDKLRTLYEIHRILKPSGTLHIADWGKQPNLILRSAFLVVQLLDGFGRPRIISTVCCRTSYPGLVLRIQPKRAGSIRRLEAYPCTAR